MWSFSYKIDTVAIALSKVPRKLQLLFLSGHIFLWLFDNINMDLSNNVLPVLILWQDWSYLLLHYPRYQCKHSSCLCHCHILFCCCCMKLWWFKHWCSTYPNSLTGLTIFAQGPKARTAIVFNAVIFSKDTTRLHVYYICVLIFLLWLNTQGAKISQVTNISWSNSSCVFIGIKVVEIAHANEP